MSLSVSGYPPGFGHATGAAMGVTSAQDYYSAAHYPSVPVPEGFSPEYSDAHRNYLGFNWMFGAGGVPDATGPSATETGTGSDHPSSSGAMLGPEVHQHHPHHHPQQVSPPNSYGTPSPVSSLGHPSVGYPSYNTDSDHTFKHWQQEYGVTPDITLAPGLGGQIPDPAQYEAYTNSYGERCYRRRTSANRKERRRTVSINNAFSNLRGSIPNVPSDTKLSKIKTLRLAISYIAYLNDVLEKGESGTMTLSEFKADISRKRERRVVVEEKKMDSCCDSDDSSGSSGSDGKSKGRTGWPQTVWASELKAASPN